MNVYSHHAKKRCQQRRISEFEVDVILEFGKSLRRRGADIYYMDKRGRRNLEKYLGRHTYGTIKDRLNKYIVLSESGTVVTSAVRLKRLHENN